MIFMSKRKTFDKVPDIITISDFHVSALKAPLTKTHGDKHTIMYFHWNPEYLLVYNSIIAMWGIIHTTKQQIFYDNYDRITDIKNVALVGTQGHTWCKTRAECVETHADILHKIAITGIVAQHAAEQAQRKAVGANRMASRAWKNGDYYMYLNESGK